MRPIFIMATAIALSLVALIYASGALPLAQSREGYAVAAALGIGLWLFLVATGYSAAGAVRRIVGC